MAIPLYDAHNHLQDGRFRSFQAQLWPALAREGVSGMVVNGSSESDWPDVLDLARAHPTVIPSFGYHPWYIKERSPHWEKRLLSFLESIPSAIGEIGLDRWLSASDAAQKEEASVPQLRIAADRT